MQIPLKLQSCEFFLPLPAENHVEFLLSSYDQSVFMPGYHSYTDSELVAF